LAGKTVDSNLREKRPLGNVMDHKIKNTLRNEVVCKLDMPVTGFFCGQFSVYFDCIITGNEIKVGIALSP
jgi:hypothetical protein